MARDEPRDRNGHPHDDPAKPDAGDQQGGGRGNAAPIAEMANVYRLKWLSGTTVNSFQPFSNVSNMTRCRCAVDLAVDRSRGPASART